MSESPEAAAQASSGAIIGTYYTIAAGYTLAASLIWGINTLFLLDAGLSVIEVFVANAGFTAGMVAFEIPTGVVADTLGRRVSFLLSIAVLGLSTTAYVAMAQVEAGVVAFTIVSVFLGLGFTFYTGAVEAWLVDALGSAGYEGVLDHVFARGEQVTGVAMLVGTVCGGFLGQVDLSLPYLVRIALLLLLFAFAWGRMSDLGFEARSLSRSELVPEVNRVARAGVHFGWSRRPIRLVMIAGAFQGAFVYFVFFAWQPYLLELLGRDAVWVAGVVSAGIALAMIAGNQLVEWWTRHCGLRTTMLIGAASAMLVAGIVLAATESFGVAVVALMIVTGSVGVIEPVRHAYLHALIPTEQRATVISFDSMVTGIGSTGGQIGLGAVANGRSYSASFLVGAAVAAVALPVLVAVRLLRSSADRIVGVSAGVQGTCAAHGAPAISGVSSESREVAAAG